MARTTWLSYGAFLAGGVLVAASFVHPAGGQSVAGAVRRGGTLRVGMRVEPPSVDPTLAATNQGWTLEYPICAKLFNLPDAPREEARV